MEVNDSAVSGTDSASVESNSSTQSAPEISATPTSEAPVQAGNSGTSGGVNNPIPYYRVQEMIAKERERYQALEAKLEQASKGWNQFGEHILKGLGLHQEPKPEFIDKQSFSQTINSLKQELATEMWVARLESELEQARRQHSDAFEVPGFRDHVLRSLQSQGNRSVSEVVADEAKKLQALFDKRAAAAAAKKVETQAQTQVIKPGSGAPAPKTDKKPPTREGRLAQLRQMLGKE